MDRDTGPGIPYCSHVCSPYSVARRSGLSVRSVACRRSFDRPVAQTSERATPSLGDSSTALGRFRLAPSLGRSRCRSRAAALVYIGIATVYFKYQLLLPIRYKYVLVSNTLYEYVIGFPTHLSSFRTTRIPSNTNLGILVFFYCGVGGMASRIL